MPPEFRAFDRFRPALAGDDLHLVALSERLEFFGVLIEGGGVLEIAADDPVTCHVDDQ